MAAISSTVDCAAFERASDGGVAAVALVFMDVVNHERPGMTTCGAGGGFRERGVRCREMVGVVCAARLVAIDTIPRAFGRIAIGSGDQGTGNGGVTCVAAAIGVDAVGTISFVVATDAGTAGEDGCEVVVDRGLMIQVVEVMLWVALSTGAALATVCHGVAVSFGQQDAGGGGVAGAAGLGFVDTD